MRPDHPRPNPTLVRAPRRSGHTSDPSTAKPTPPQAAAALRLLMADAQTNPTAAAALRTFTDHRRDTCLELLSRAQEHDALSTERDPGVMTDVILGTVWYRLLTAEPIHR
ncbi:TetR/AcrR family transcriptional regulator C-terminal ligand-binding domain-containing protein [Nonomuraea sp. NPDC049750]|uniref:TetR/AcrR family transcriptional regulator C-terminal ligand-binding domain-containing protein n=1 Tax=Nonomuraea sp. NPDC049750 TaxID=3154738 RepID=UPI0034003876